MKTSKELFNEIKEQQAIIYNDATLGEVNILDALLMMRGFKSDAEEIIEKVKTFENDFIDEISSESVANNGAFKGYDIVEVKGREVFDFKNIPDFVIASKELKDVQETYKQAFKLAQKGQIPLVDGEWITADGEVKPLPEYSRGKGYIKVTKSKQ